MLKLNASSLALGAALAVGSMLVMGQAGPQPQYVSWGPPKAGVVNVFVEGSTSVPANGYTSVYQVPPDRWVTITDARIVSSTALATRYSEELGGVLTDKGFAEPSYDLQSSTGWTFRPGSQIVIRNTSSGAGSFTRLVLIGYQTRD